MPLPRKKIDLSSEVSPVPEPSNVLISNCRSSSSGQVLWLKANVVDVEDPKNPKLPVLMFFVLLVLSCLKKFTNCGLVLA